MENTPIHKEIIIAMIDDNRHDNDVFSIALNDLHIRYYCRFIKTVEDAVKLLPNIVPDFIFIDMSLLNSMACFKRIKKIKLLKNIPLIALSDLVDDTMKEEIIQNGADICIQMTSNTADMIQLLKKIFSEGQVYNASNGQASNG